MKIFTQIIFLLVLLSACGQPGPLYLPKDQPSVLAEPVPAPNTETEVKKDQAKDAVSSQPPQSTQPPK